MKSGFSLHLILLPLLVILQPTFSDLVYAGCELSITDNRKLYTYNLAKPTKTSPHGALSEDGYYKVSHNGTVVWFQLCDAMIFNHNPPKCVDCWDCGGSSRCGMGCSALMSNIVAGYPVCTTIGLMSSSTIDLIDKKSPQMGVIVKMLHIGPGVNCSLAVSVICDLNEVQGPQTLENVGICEFVTQLKHPSGCATIVSAHGNGLGWFGTTMIIVLCLFGAYLLAGAAYRFFYLGIRGIDIIPNLEFWASIPHRVQSSFMSLVRRFRGPSQGYRSSYSPVSF